MIEPKLRFKADDGSNFPEWEEHKIKEFVIESNILGHTGKEAKKLTVKLWGKGVVPKENIFSGSENTQYYIRHSGQLMYGKLDFLNCAFGIVPPELDGYESTLDAPAFDIHDISDKFLLSYITRKSFYKKNGDIANGSRKAKRIHPDVFGEMSIMVPSLPEQQKIAEFLSTIDTVIEKQKETVSAWEERKKGVMQKLFNQEVRFKADDGSDFPEWEEHEIAELIQLYNEKVSSDCQLPILTSSKKNGIEYQEEHFAGKQRHDIEGYNVLPRNYCTYRNRSDGTDFTFNINKLCDKGIVSKFYPVFKENDCDLFFLVSLLNNERKAVRKIAYTAKGTGQKVLSITDLRNITVDMPSLPEQQKIADCLSSLDEVIEKQKATLAAWEELKKGLLQQMFV